MLMQSKQNAEAEGNEFYHHSAALSALAGSNPAGDRKLPAAVCFGRVQRGLEQAGNEQQHTEHSGAISMNLTIQHYFHFLVRPELLLPRGLVPKLKREKK